GPGLYARYGTTMDDAAGEAFDKSASVLGLGYPGGPAIEKAAIGGQPNAIQLPRPRRNATDCHFSFSGLKTAVATRWQAANDAHKEGRQDAPSVADFAASLQQAIADSLVARTKRALHRFYDETGSRQLVVAGGVAANQTVRHALQELATAEGFTLSTPPLSLCTDNGAMIAWVGCEYFQLNRTSPLTFAPRPRWPLDDEAPPPPGRGIRS
ncbi:tRNA (adenosine(37)-N6)-threonylcarbamoyltransferase complex transferase subunit TsaD, partial [Alphaproteobacteria bacterium]|nr:tRNA (adenosine(37)-N6)-threonylcarbamoyltransferase complex transferase subunit TsaD [Alphaproteobacteria bacterium]